MTESIGRLDLEAWLSIIGIVLAIPPVAVFAVHIINNIRRSSPRIAVHEFALLVRQPWHVVMLSIIGASTAYLVSRPPQSFPASLGVLIPLASGLCLLVSFFLAQSRQLSHKVVLDEMRRLSQQTRRQPHQECSAIRFDIDRLKALSNYSTTVGDRVRQIAAEVIKDEVDRLRKHNLDVSCIEIPGEDETIVVAAGLSESAAADFADTVRRRVKMEVARVPGYSNAVEAIVEQVQPPSSIDEERQGIGTISAGVAVDRGIPEIFLSDVSAAVKESKVRGRNKTVIYKPGGAPEIHSDYVRPTGDKLQKE